MRVEKGSVVSPDAPIQTSTGNTQAMQNISNTPFQSRGVSAAK